MDSKFQWLTDSRTDELTDWPTDGLTNWRTDELTDWRTDGLTNWRTDGMMDGYSSGYALLCTKKILGTYFQKPAKTFWKNALSPMENGRIEFSVTFQQPRWNSVQNANIQLFCYINSNCVFSKNIWNHAVAQLRRVGLNFRDNIDVLPHMHPCWDVHVDAETLFESRRSIRSFSILYLLREDYFVPIVDLLVALKNIP